MKRIICICLALLFGGCSTYLGYELKPGEAGLEDVIQTLGKPAMRWQNADGSEQLAFPRGPMGLNTYMVNIDTDGKLQQIENVLTDTYFARIKPGMSKEEVLRILGPSYPAWTVYFERRDELVWEWRYCDTWNATARFNVLFDNSSGKVRSTLRLTEEQRGLCGREGHCGC
ncbi:MAG: hypothetical protein WC236_09065 [Gallionellaceae bacterium]|jgi:hypothetical protein